MTTYYFLGSRPGFENDLSHIKNYNEGSLNGPEATALPTAVDDVVFTDPGFGMLTINAADSLWLTSGSVTANSATGAFTTAGDTGAAATITINGTIDGHVRSRVGGSITAETATGTVQSLGGAITITKDFTVTTHGTNSIDLSVSSGGAVNIDGKLDVRNAGGQVNVGRGLLDVDDELLLGVAANNAVINIFDNTGMAKLAAKSLTIGSETATQNECGDWQRTGNNGQLVIAGNGYVSLAETLVLASPGISASSEGVDINLLGTNASMQIGGDDGPVANRLTISAGGTLQGHGRIDAKSVVNDGSVFAEHGTLRFVADVSGFGVMHVGDGARIISAGDFFDVSKGSNSNSIVFDTRTDESFLTESIFEIQRPHLFTGEITGLDIGDTIVLSGRRSDASDSFRTWTGFQNPTISHTEIDTDTNQLHITFTDYVPFTNYNARSVTKTIDIGGALADHTFSVRNLSGNDQALSFMNMSSQIILGTDGSPTNGINPYIDSLINGWAEWDKDADPITYWFGTTADVHKAVEVHGETNIIQCEDTVGTWDPGGLEKGAVEHAFEVYKSTTKLDFQEASSVETANIVFWLTPIAPGVLGRSERPSVVSSGHLWVYFDDATWTEEGLQFGGDNSLEVIHEIGHVLGLAHTHDGGYESDRNLFPGVTFNQAQDRGDFGQNQQIYTVMSYARGWNGVSPTPPPMEYGSQGGLGAFDIAALQLLYDKNTTYKSSGDVYTLPTENKAGTGWQALWDTGGTDTISHAGKAGDSVIDLRAAPLIGPKAGGYESYVKSILGGFTIANGVVIENATGGTGIDTITGNAASNLIDGGAGIDTMTGGLGDDTYLVDNKSDKVIELKSEGTDTVETTQSTYTLPANVEILRILGTGPVIMNGSASDNIIIANDFGGTIDGGAGNDTIIGGAGNDILKGGAGNDTLSYLGAAGPVTINLSLTTKQDNSAALQGFDTLATFENIIGSAFADTLVGTTSANVIDGGAGADQMTGGKGNDTYHVDDLADTVTELTNEGTDTVIIHQGGPTSFDLAAGTPWANIEHVSYLGSDDISFGAGSATDNILTGGSGADVLNGAAGNDRLSASQGAADGKADQLTGGAGNDVFVVYEGQALDLAMEASLADGIDTVESLAAAYTLGAFIENLIIKGGVAGAARFATGNDRANILTGDVSDDTLDGAVDSDPLFVDQLIGGKGNDIYVVRDAKDKVTEAASQGTDTVVAHASVTLLAANVENLQLAGTAGAINGTGNTLANTITGNSSNNILDGGTGNDLIAGGLGDDILKGGAGIDTVSYATAAGAVTIDLALLTLQADGDVFNDTLSGFENIIGSANGDTLTGTSLANRIDGGLGADTMTGLAGDDIYVVDDAGDKVFETIAGGTKDKVQSTITYDLGDIAPGDTRANVENLDLLDVGDINGTGNALANTITGNSFKNTLSGGAGDGKADTLIGGGGDDIYIVEILDKATELAGGGTDTIETALTTVLGLNLENLTFTGAAAVNATGNTVTNTLIGNGASNVLNGMLGNDILTGAGGADFFVFSTKLDALSNVDTITDFTVVDDTIRLENAVFTKLTKLGGLDANAFHTGTTTADALDRIIYDDVTGKLYYDSDGTGAAAQVQFATLGTGLGLANTDFVVI